MVAFGRDLRVIWSNRSAQQGPPSTILWHLSHSLHLSTDGKLAEAADCHIIILVLTTYHLGLEKVNLENNGRDTWHGRNSQVKLSFLTRRGA